jgi:hypothetical protein
LLWADAFVSFFPCQTKRRVPVFIKLRYPIPWNRFVGLFIRFSYAGKTKTPILSGLSGDWWVLRVFFRLLRPRRRTAKAPHKAAFGGKHEEINEVSFAGGRKKRCF